MSKQVLIKFDTTNGGMTNDARDTTPGVFRVTKNFDNYTNTHKLTPHRSMEVDAVTESTLDEFRITKFVPTSSGLFGFGVVSSADSHAQVYVKTTASDPTAVWTTASGTSTSASGGARSDVLFVLYRNYLYGANSTGVWKYGDISGSPGTQTFTYNEYTTNVPTAQGIVHSKDDILYIPSNAKIIVNNAGSWSVGLTLPTNSTITSICEHGNYLAIACDQPEGTSVVYLWDRDSSLSTTSEKIDWGVGSLKLIENIGGTLVGISTTSANLTGLTPKVMIKYYNGADVDIIKEYECSLATIVAGKQKFNNLFYFLAEMTIEGTALKGLWKIAKKPGGGLTVSFDRMPRNDTALDAGTLKGFYRWGDYVFIAYLVPTTGLYTVWRTNDQATYSASSIVETIKYDAGDAGAFKDTVGATVTFEPLPSGGSVSLAYKCDAETSFTTLFTHTTQDSVSHSAVNVESTGAKVPQHKLIEWRITSSGGAEITGFECLEEITGKKPY